MKFLRCSLLIVILIFACTKKPAAPTITGWEKYEDPYVNIGFKYPQNWTLVPEGSRFTIVSSPEVMNRFYDYSQKGVDGARIVVYSEKMDTLQTLAQYIEQVKTDMTAAGFDLKGTDSTKLGKLNGIRIHCGGFIDKDNRIESIQVAAVQDSNRYTVKYEAFNDLYEPYKSVLDSVLTSLKLPRSKTIEKGVDPSIPSTEYEKFDNDRLAISYPDNFDINFPPAKAPSEFAMDLKGYRQDCFIHIDIIPAKGLAPEKVVEQNAKYFKETSRGSTTIDGIKTTYLNYSPVKNIQSRVYFLVKNDKIYRIIINYVSSMKSVFLPPFEKTIASFKAK